MMPYLNCQFAFESESTIDELASLLSRTLLGGIRFTGKEDGIYEQTPALHSEQDVFGHRVILCAGREQNVYLLQVRPGMGLLRALSPDEMRRIGRADIGDFLALILRQIPGIKCLE